MSHATISSLPSPSRSKKRASETIGTGAAPFGPSVVRSKPVLASGAGQGSGAASASGARASK